MESLAEKVAVVPYWYHRIVLPDGTVTPGWAPISAERYCVPADLTGKRVLDVGAWDGYWTWEALKRGAAEVMAFDDFSDTCGLPIKRENWRTFDLCRNAFGFDKEYEKNKWQNDKDQTISRLDLSIYEVTPDRMGQFDVIFFFGTIYHLKHPLLALEKLSMISRGSIYVETASLDDYSPYRGGIGRGFVENEMVMEFYPGAQYGNNPSNWWAPTLQCLGAMLESCGWKQVSTWPLTEQPTNLAECRGFASGTKDPEKEWANRPAEVELPGPIAQARVAAVMSVPRLGFTDNMSCAYSILFALHIPLINVQGAFWGQCLERGIQQLIDASYDIILTIDYDTLFTRQDVEGILRLMYLHPEATAIVPLQVGRAGQVLLMSMKTLTGQDRVNVPQAELQAETIKIATGHFGLTALRVKDLLDVPHPWFHDQPNADEQWGPGRTDADIYFWRKIERRGKTALVACRIAIGHLILKGIWPDKNLKVIYQSPEEFHDKGKPPNVWQ